MQNEIQESVDGIGILSLSEVRDDILMWSHYAGGHKGICLEFEATEFTDFFGYALPVVYLDERPRFDYQEDSFTQVEKIILSKAKHWSYEKEWRILKPPELGGGDRSYEYPPRYLKGVIFGCWIEPSLERLVRQWISLGASNPAFFRARVSERLFGLDIVAA